MPSSETRVCFQLQVDPSRITEYRERHAAVWPEMLHALESTGWHNYSLFPRLAEVFNLEDQLAAQATSTLLRKPKEQ